MCLRHALINYCLCDLVVSMQDYRGLFNENGMPKPSFPNHWKGNNGIYCAGFSRRGLDGIAFDAQRIADDIKKTLNARNLPGDEEDNFASLKLLGK